MNVEVRFLYCVLLHCGEYMYHMIENYVKEYIFLCLCKLQILVIEGVVIIIFYVSTVVGHLVS